MTQSWKHWSWKLGVVIAVVTSAIASCSYYAFAQNTKIFPEIERLRQQQEPQAPGGINKLRLKSIRLDAPANNPSPSKVWVYIQEKNHSSGPYTINPGTELPLSMDECFNDTLTVELDAQVNQKYPQIVGSRPVLANSSLPLVFGNPNSTHYTLNYEIVSEGCKEQQ